MRVFTALCICKWSLYYLWQQGQVFKRQRFVANNKNLPKVYIEEVKANVITDNKINVSDYKTNGEAKPYRIYANQDFLSGRIVTNDIFGLNNEIVAKKEKK